MAGISRKRYKTKNGYRIKYVITYRDNSGRQDTTGCYDSVKEAKRNLYKYEQAETKTADTITYGKIFGSFLKKAKNKYAKITFQNYERYYNKYFKIISDVPYEEISSIDWQEFFDETEKRTSPYVAQTCLKFAKAAVNYMIKHDFIETNVFNKIEKIKLPKADINHLEIEELKLILNMCKIYYPQYYVLLFTFIGTGARGGEILALTKEDFNYKEENIRINKQYTNRELKAKTKTESSNRKIYLFEELNETLNEHIKTLKSDNKLLFPNTSGGYINANNLRRRFFYPLLKRSGIIKRVRLHDLRGSYIDMVLSSGLSIKFAQEQAGHSRSETTLNTYAKNSSDMIKTAEEKINFIFKNVRKM